MKDACPISFRKVDETVARLVALLVFVSAIAGCFVYLPWIVAALALDFSIRAFTSWPISYLALVAKLIAKVVGLKPRPINAGPKIFAARVGFVFTFVIAVLGFMDLIVIAKVLAGLLALFAALEGFFAFCVGCHLYSLLNRLRS